MKHSKYEFLSLALIAIPSVWAQTIPDAGALMRQNEQMFKQEQMQRYAQRRSAFPPVMALNDDTQVTPERIKFLDAKLLTERQLQVVAEPYLKRALNQHDLHLLMDAVEQAYRSAGWIVRVYIPQQDLTQAELRIQIQEKMPASAR